MWPRISQIALGPYPKANTAHLTKFMQHSRNVGGIFNHPVDTRNPSLANYLSKIERPIDLGTIRGRLQKGEFETVAKISQDMLRVFDNAMAYNPEEYHLHQPASYYEDRTRK